MNADKLAKHYETERYGSFWLTDAIRPAPDLQVVPREGYRVGTFRDEGNALSVPMLAAAVSREKLFDVFLALLAPLGKVVDVVVETSHDGDGGHRDLYREHIDSPVLLSVLCDFEDLLLHDGCTGVAVIGRERPVEVQFDEHKQLLVYAADLQPFRRAVRAAGLRCDDGLKLLSEGEHLHGSHPRHAATFPQLCSRLGVGEPVEHVNW